MLQSLVPVIISADHVRQLGGFLQGYDDYEEDQRHAKALLR